MPTHPNRAATWIKSGKATPFWKRGVFCVRLNQEPSSRNLQDIAVGIDPGSKKEGFTIKSETHTFLNIQSDAVTWVKDALQTRKEMRRARRFRTTPCRKPRFNLSKGNLPPSTKARWQWKLRICVWLKKMFPITDFIVEDIKAWTKGKRRWDQSFSPLEVGKKWFYGELEKLGNLSLKQGWETKELRDNLGLKKNGNKISETFDAHCVDSWVLANSFIGGHIKPDNTNLLLVTPLRFHRRQLHMLQFAKGGIRRRNGGTRSLGFKRGSLVKHPKWGLTYVGGFCELLNYENLPSTERFARTTPIVEKRGISLHSLADGQRLTQNANPLDCKFLSYNTWRTGFPLPAEADSLQARSFL
jgi:hypothetical protein